MINGSNGTKIIGIILYLMIVGFRAFVMKKMVGQCGMVEECNSNRRTDTSVVSLTVQKEVRLLERTLLYRTYRRCTVRILLSK